MTKHPLTIALATAGFALFSAGAFAQVDTSTGTTNPTEPPSEQRPLQSGPAAQQVQQSKGDSELKSGELSESDHEFLISAAQSGLTEIEGSRIALESDPSPEVRAFAQKMIDEHTRANEELRQLADRKGFTLPDEPSVAQRAELVALRALSGGPMNRAYAARIGEAAHENAVELFQRAASEAQDADIRAYAEKMLPKLQEHLKMARELREKVRGD